MSQNKNIFLSIFMLLLLCNQIDGMKRPRENQTQDIVVVASVVQPQDCLVAQVVTLPAKEYWDGKSPYEGSKIIKATSDHDCKHCNKKITDESIAAHAFKHLDIYCPRPQKRLRIDVIEISDESSVLSRTLSCGSSSLSESSSSSEESSSSSEDSSESSSSSEESPDSFEDLEDNKPGFIAKILKNGRVVYHMACDVDGCRFACARSEEMNNHKKLHGVDKCKVCKKCHFRTTSPIVFFNHTQKHLPKEKRSNMATCYFCNKVLSKESSLKRHISTQHP